MNSILHLLLLTLKPIPIKLLLILLNLSLGEAPRGEELGDGNCGGFGLTVFYVVVGETADVKAGEFEGGFCAGFFLLLLFLRDGRELLD